MENLFKELAWKCYENELAFTYFSHGSIDIASFQEGDGELQRIGVSYGILEGYEEFETPTETLERMHREVDQFIEKEHMDDMENVYFERPRGVSSDELKMKESGHKISDFE